MMYSNAIKNDLEKHFENEPLPLEEISEAIDAALMEMEPDQTNERLWVYQMAAQTAISELALSLIHI